MTSPATHRRVRVGIDVGGTFTDAVAVDAATLDLLAQVKLPTTHHHPDGVAHGIVEALDRLLDATGGRAEDVVFMAHGTTQATNALLEGDVATVGLIGIGSGPGAFATARLASLGKLPLTEGHTLPLRYAHVPDPADTARIDAAIETLRGQGATVLVASEPFSVDLAEGEDAVLDRCRAAGVPATAAHEITSLYGLRKRTRTAVVNAAILPTMLATATLVDSSITKAGITAPLMVMRCDGGVMSLDEMRQRPLLTILSGPAAGVAGALMRERVGDGVFLETGGTSTDISLIHRGQVAMRYATILGKPSYLSALDVRTVGVGGGSMVHLAGGAVTGVGPRSAHIAGLPYACFADAEDLRDARLTTIAPMDGDSDDHAVIEAAGGRFAITMTCAANAAGLVADGDFAHADPHTAQLALKPLAAALGTDVATAARAVLDAGIAHIQPVVDKLLDDYQIDRALARLVGGGGGAASVLPHLGDRMALPGTIADHAEVISPIGVALALIREQVQRTIPGAGPDQILAVREEAARAVAAQGAAPGSVEVEVTVDAQTDTVTAIATGATEMRTQTEHDEASADSLLATAATSLHTDPAQVSQLAHTDWYTVFGTEQHRRFRQARHPLRVLDAGGVLRLSAQDAQLVTTTVRQAPGVLRDLIASTTSYGDGGVRAPALRLLIETRIADLSGVLDVEPLLALAQAELDGHRGDESVIAIVEQRA